MQLYYRIRDLEKVRIESSWIQLPIFTGKITDKKNVFFNVFVSHDVWRDTWDQVQI